MNPSGAIAAAILLGWLATPASAAAQGQVPAPSPATTAPAPGASTPARQGLPSPGPGPAPAVDAIPSDAAAARNDDAALFRVFLKDGTSLVSFGEPAQLDDRIVFSMPTSARQVPPQLHLVTIPSDRVDWERTNRYGDSARATRYVATRAEQDYALLTDEVAQALNDVSQAPDAPTRLAIVEKARRTLAEWPARHYNYKQQEIRQMLGVLDEAIAELRAAAGLQRFDLNFVAAVDMPVVREPLMPAPTAQQAIEQTILAASLTPSSVERVSLLTTVLGNLERDLAELDGAWAWTTRVAVRTMIDTEIAVDRLYQNLTKRYVSFAEQRARAADVRGVQSLLGRIAAEDKALGGRRPEAVATLVASVQEQLDAAQRLRLARDRWLLKSDEYKAYATAVAPQLQRLKMLRPALEDIKSLAGSTPQALALIQTAADEILKA
ncbi:MAG: hypothetical protein AB7O32_11855, partial [Vicinamibacterales bacterium]